MLEWQTQKSWKNRVLGPSFWDRFETVLHVFATLFSSTFSEPLVCWISSPRATEKGQFWSTWDTKCNISLLNMEKWKMHSRSREDTKIKLSRVCVSLQFLVYWCVVSKLAPFTRLRRHHSSYTQFTDPFDLHFWPQNYHTIHFIFVYPFSPNNLFRSEIRSRASATHHR